MGLPVDFTLRARDDLREIAAYIARRNPDRARTFRGVLYRKATALSNHPKMGRVVPELRDPDVREIIHGTYRIVYELTNNPGRVLILRFWHAARGMPQIVQD